ncbi:MAG: hypothetical protein ACOC2M_02525 [bacterium]
MNKILFQNGDQEMNIRRKAEKSLKQARSLYSEYAMLGLESAMTQKLLNSFLTFPPEQIIKQLIEAELPEVSHGRFAVKKSEQLKSLELPDTKNFLIACNRLKQSQNFDANFVEFNEGVPVINTQYLEQRIEETRLYSTCNEDEELHGLMVKAASVLNELNTKIPLFTRDGVNLMDYFQLNLKGKLSLKRSGFERALYFFRIRQRQR